MKRIICLLMAVLLVGCLCAPAIAEGAPAPAASIDLTAIINAAIALIGAILTYKVIPYIKEKLNEAQYRRMEALVNIGVYAAEEIYRSGHGDEKLLYVQNYLRSKGYDVDIEQIKAAVKKMRDGESSDIVINQEVSSETHGIENEYADDMK